MRSPELLNVVENCPVGAETLILRILHILTENGNLNVTILNKHSVSMILILIDYSYHNLCYLATPTAELVKRVRDLYEKNGQYVRFLIPILNGLEKVSLLCSLEFCIYYEHCLDSERLYRYCLN